MAETLTQQIEHLKGLLDRLPGELADARRGVSDRRKDVEMATSSLKDREAETLTLVSAEVNVAGKPSFSNKEAREAEVRSRLRQDTAYLLLKRQLDDAETEKLNAELRLNQLQDEERSLDRKLDAVANQIRAESIRELAKTVVELTALEAKRMAGMGAG